MILKITKEQEKEIIKNIQKRMKEADAKKCNKQITTYVWGNPQNPDTWNCILEKEHKGQHKRYD